MTKNNNSKKKSMPHFNTLKSIRVTLYAIKGSKKNV